MVNSRPKCRYSLNRSRFGAPLTREKAEVVPADIAHEIIVNGLLTFLPDYVAVRRDRSHKGSETTVLVFSHVQAGKPFALGHDPAEQALGLGRNKRLDGEAPSAPRVMVVGGRAIHGLPRRSRPSRGWRPSPTMTAGGDRAATCSTHFAPGACLREYRLT